MSNIRVETFKEVGSRHVVRIVAVSESNTTPQTMHLRIQDAVMLHDLLYKLLIEPRKDFFIYSIEASMYDKTNI